MPVKSVKDFVALAKFAPLLRAEVTKWAEIVKAPGAKAE